jgi:hypothetical protein
MKCTDERMNLTTEALSNIKMLKLYSWVDHFKGLIQEKRLKEIKAF